MNNVDVPAMDIFLSAPTSQLQDMELTRYEIQIVPIAICCIIFGAHMNTLRLMKVMILLLIKWSSRSPQSCWLLSSVK